MSRLVGRCPWCQRTVELELALVALERFVAETGLRPRGAGRPSLPGGPTEGAGKQRLRDAKKRAAREREGS